MTKEETWATLVALGVVEGKSTQTGWNLHEADLSEVDLSEADLRGADLSGADLIGAHLRGADLSGADLSGANLRVAYLRRADLSQADLHEADLTLAYLAGASLIGANLGGADLHGANLTDADLTASVLIKTDLTKANLSGACIDDANISEWVIKDVTCSYIIEAKSGKQVQIEFEPLEFEKEYAQTGKTAEVITYLSGGNSMTDLQRLIEKYEKKMAELEAQVEVLRHKHDILLEASRLLEEEVLTPGTTLYEKLSDASRDKD
ncbi:MAG TPA: pentapeptide repeat-containing protein [Syntrophorhabdales bacterium]|nr:pentapeptide repeat-containing protein [Syntrophorhabdales bacterium]